MRRAVVLELCAQEIISSIVNHRTSGRKKNAFKPFELSLALSINLYYYYYCYAYLSFGSNLELLRVCS